MRVGKASLFAMTLSEFFKCQPRGSLRALARTITAHASDVSSWANGKRPVPIIFCVAIEKATGGAVARKDLRPDDWHLIWPELAQTEAAEAA